MWYIKTRWRISHLIAMSSNWRFRGPASPSHPSPSASSIGIKRPSYIQGGESSPTPLDRDFMEGLRPDSIETIDPPTKSTDYSDEGLTIKDVEYLGSYQWLKEATPEAPVILVPGAPPEWIDRPTPFKIPQGDQGYVFSDRTGYFMGTQPLVPLIAATEVMTPGFDWSSVDFVTDRNGLRKLMRFATASGYDRSFRIDTQLAGDTTILLNRWEQRVRERASQWSYGFEFEKATTTPAQGCENTTGYYRIVTYDLDGLKLVVRFEVDACLREEASDGAEDVDDLVQTMFRAGLTEKSEVSFGGGRTLQVKRGGKPTAQSNLVELATITSKWAPKFKWEDRYPQLYLSATPYHYLGVHSYGIFQRYEKRRTEEMETQKETMKRDLYKLRDILLAIQGLVVDHGEEKVSILYRDKEMKVYKRSNDASCLPKDYMDLFQV
ncbi:hypothetical protein CYLTODRAFT_387077 [Cylindrobasidium torrendii FP15055 ss-10]|uniref:Geranylgeranyl pyrophosphate synthetase n=1 Tax=Cylindrobasidium torrendii FP15055 ss-10 TaxID=1314674 RepID=A0A0D7BT44_9AGAR|nr:hypothetical protein CYLTODRAFT_387077 [Cylindrobasidium torrendii FP15055 ss-10]